MKRIHLPFKLLDSVIQRRSTVLRAFVLIVICQASRREVEGKQIKFSRGNRGNTERKPPISFKTSKLKITIICCLTVGKPLMRKTVNQGVQLVLNLAFIRDCGRGFVLIISAEWMRHSSSRFNWRCVGGRLRFLRFDRDKKSAVSRVRNRGNQSQRTTENSVVWLLHGSLVSMIWPAGSWREAHRKLITAKILLING